MDRQYEERARRMWEHPGIKERTRTCRNGMAFRLAAPGSKVTVVLLHPLQQSAWFSRTVT